MKSIYYNDEKKLILEFTEEIDHHNTEKIRRKVDYEIEKYMPNKVVLNFDKVIFMDSAGIGFLIGRYKMVKMVGAEIEMINVKPSIKKIFEMCGIPKVS